MKLPDNLEFVDQTELTELLKNCELRLTPTYDDIFKVQKIQTPPSHIAKTNNLIEEQNNKIDDLTARLDKANSELSKQTDEMLSIHCKNIELLAQIKVLQNTIDRQVSEISVLKDTNIVSKNTILGLRKTVTDLKNMNKHSSIIGFISGVAATIIGGVIVWWITTMVLSNVI